MTIQNKIKIATILFVLISAVCFTQVPPPGNEDVDTAPIDGSVLIGACIALFYGVKKIIKK